MTYPDLATCQGFTLVAAICRPPDQLVMLKGASGAIVLDDDGAPLTFSSIASAVAWCRA